MGLLMFGFEPHCSLSARGKGCFQRKRREEERERLTNERGTP